MEEFALYLFKSVVWLAGFTLVFILFLKNERFFLLNRIYLIAGMLTSLIFPLVSVHYTVVLPAVATLNYSSVISGAQIVKHSVMPDIKTILSALYFTGVGFVILLAFRQCRSVFRAIKKSEVISLQDVKLLKTSEYTSAFSFFSYVFVNPSVTDIETKEIMIHEMVHIRQKHWFDLLLVELLRMMQWFNPLVWIYVRFIRQNHEYLADEVALQQTSDPAIYKAVLLNQIVGAPVISLSNSFNYSPNKKRFYMMKNIMTSPYRKLKVLLILPVFAFVLFAFAKPDYKYKYADQNQSGIVASDTLKHGKALPPPPPPVSESLDSKEVQPPPPPPPSIDELPASPPPPGPAMVINRDGTTPLYVIDGIIVTEAEAKLIDPTTVETVDVLKSSSTKYGKKGINGVVEITLKKNTSLKQSLSPQVKTDSEKRPLVIIDGKIMNIDVNTIDPKSIESTNVLKGKMATDKYGEKASDGAIEVQTKIDQKVEIVSVNDVKPLIVIDGVVTKDTLSSIKPEIIESINVIKDNDAVIKYDEKGKNGVVEISVKKDVQVRRDEKATEEVKVEKEVPVEKAVPVKK